MFFDILYNRYVHWVFAANWLRQDDNVFTTIQFAKTKCYTYHDGVKQWVEWIFLQCNMW